MFQWDLVCEQRGLNQATATFFFVGVTIGAVVFGYLSDRFDPLRLSTKAAVSWQGLHTHVTCKSNERGEKGENTVVNGELSLLHPN